MDHLNKIFGEYPKFKTVNHPKVPNILNFYVGKVIPQVIEKLKNSNWSYTNGENVQLANECMSVLDRMLVSISSLEGTSLMAQSDFVKETAAKLEQRIKDDTVKFIYMATMLMLSALPTDDLPELMESLSKVEN